MSLKLGRKPEMPPGSGHQSPLPTVKKLSNRGDILSCLEPRRAYAVSAFAHLEPGFPEIAKWHVANQGERFALCLVARGLFPTYMLTMGDTSILEFLMGSVGLPGRAFITCEPEHLDVIRSFYEFEWHLLMKRMVVTRDTFAPANEKAARLKPSHVGEVNRLYALEHSGNFTSAQLRRGVFYGIWQDERLVAVAGTHFISPTYNIAYVGNVMTHPAHRNQGLATICVSSVTSKLLEQCDEVVLNVESYNLPAVRTYTGLGYSDHCQIIEGVGHRKSFIGAIINNVCRKLGLIPKYEGRMEPDG
jgi:RimJ/RimL family protein N-acetyltransferase